MSPRKTSQKKYDEAGDEIEDAINQELYKTEDGAHEGNKTYASNIYHGLMPYARFMNVLGRFPLHARKHETKAYEYYYSAKSPTAIAFIISGIVVAIITILVLMNLFGLLMNSPAQKNYQNISDQILRTEELYLFRRNLVPVIILVTILVHATIANYNFYARRHFAASYLNFWTEAVEIFKIDVAHGLPRYMKTTMGLYGGFLILFILSSVLRFAPVSTGAPAMCSILLLRFISPHLHAMENFPVIRSCAAFLFFYVIIASKSFIFYFLYHCKIMRNAFIVWNHRLDRVLHRGEASLPRAEKIVNRTGFDHLFKDHVCLLDLLEGADTLFANIIESYYATQIVSVCFEVYYFYRSQSAQDEFQGVRRLDGIIITLYLLHTFLILFIVSVSAAEVGEEAMSGLEVIRRKGMLGKKTDEELYFMLSMFISYTGHSETALTGGKYFVLDKSFLVAVIGTVFSYFIVLIQFTPTLELTAESNFRVRDIDTTALLARVEETRDIFRLQGH